jgi:polyisoprenoid-binding protein YceI
MRISGRLARLKTRRGASIAIGCVVALGVGAFALVYFLLLPTSSPQAFSLTESTVPSSTAQGRTAVASASQIAGTWAVSTGSEVGYRVREKLAFLPAQSDAVGRTSKVSGNITLARSGSTAKVTAASFTAEVNTLKSDRSMRDDRIHTIGLESDKYPTATFKLTSPFAVPANALQGQVGKIQATGVLTIHGTSKTATIPLEMTVSNSTLETTGSLTFPWSEFGMTAPSIGGAVSVTDKATMEFDLHLARS